MADHQLLHDYTRSRAVVMGTWDYTHLSPVPAAENSLRRMAGLLTGPLCDWPAERVARLGNEQRPGDLADQMVALFEDVQDIALFYYVGHGQLDYFNELCLGLVGSRTEPHRRTTTSLPFEAVRRALSHSDAKMKIVILDCCFSGWATDRNYALAPLTEDVLDKTGGTGAYTMAASSSSAWFETAPATPQTYFTKHLADLLEAGIPDLPSGIRLEPLFTRLCEKLVQAGRPTPRARSVDAARDFVFARNASPMETRVDKTEGYERLLARNIELEAALRAQETAPLLTGGEPLPAQISEPGVSKVHAHVAWLADHTGMDFMHIYSRVVSSAARLRRQSDRERSDRAYRRSRVSREQIVDALTRYYSRSLSESRGMDFYRVHLGGVLLKSSVLTHSDWLRIRVSLASENAGFILEGGRTQPDLRIDDAVLSAAVEKLADVEVNERHLMNLPTYHLLDIAASSSRLDARMGTVGFLGYALTLNLLEDELLDEIAASGVTEETVHNLPLRDHYLPSLDALLSFSSRVCAGGPAVLLAIARPKRGYGAALGADYAVHIQRRAPKVINATGQYAVIPKAFHQPFLDRAGEVSLASTVEREFEEELLGRKELIDPKSATQIDPLHSVSEPLQWLRDHPTAYRLESVGFGLNTVSGNYEFPCLMIIYDDEWWTRYRGRMIRNYEAASIEPVSTLDPATLQARAADQSWSNEGLFAFIEGLRRLGEVGSEDRINLPPIEVDIA